LIRCFSESVLKNGIFGPVSNDGAPTKKGKRPKVEKKEMSQGEKKLSRYQGAEHKKGGQKLVIPHARGFRFSMGRGECAPAKKGKVGSGELLKFRIYRRNSRGEGRSTKLGYVKSEEQGLDFLHVDN